jgi:hypothetical protein
MIAFSKLGNLGRLGNQLFQYAFIRSVAEKLSVPFYCPPWIGDEIFELDDAAIRADKPHEIKYQYVEPRHCTGYDERTSRIVDGTDVSGFFQTEKYFEAAKVRRWFTFREEKIAGVRARHAHIDFSSTICLGVRLGDFVSDYRDTFYVPRTSYYARALSRLPTGRTVLVFSDDIVAAERYLHNVVPDAIFVNEPAAFESLYLWTCCRDFICSPSTFNWWGAWLGRHPDKKVIVPAEGPFRAGAYAENPDFWPDPWTRIAALRPLVDRREAVVIRARVMRALRKGT